MLRNYLLTAYKVFMRRKLFTAINLMCIVLTLVVLMVLTAMLENAFFPTGVEGKSDRFLQVSSVHARSADGRNITTGPLGYKLIDTYLKPMPSVERVAVASRPRKVAIYQEGRITTLEMRLVDANYWKVLDFTLLEGRLPNEDDDAQGLQVAVVNASSAKRLFGSGSVVGRTISASGQALKVIGVVQDEMHLNAYAELWAPIASSPTTSYKHEMFGSFTALLLARSSNDLDMVRQNVKEVAKTVQFNDARANTRTLFWADDKLDVFARATMWTMEQEDSGARKLLLILGTLMFLFMLLPALNLVNLNTGRIVERSSEIGVRKAFGATSAQLVGQLVVENLLLCLAGGIIGLACAQAVLMWIAYSGVIPYLRLSINLPVMAYGFIITVVFGLLSGVLPAWKMSRLDPVHALKGTA
jgi:putative ABC transport system permease protein